MTELGYLGAPASAPQRDRPVVLDAGGVSIDYPASAGALRAVEDVSFRVHRGERLVLLGPSGCGKSSLLKAVAGFLPIARGTLRGNGVAITRPGPDRAVVFQEFDQLLPWKTVVGNVAFPLRMARGLARKEARAAALAALDKVGLAEFADAHPHTLSGGMKQRVAIARAIAVEPDVLLMDEPFAALDALTRRTLQEELVSLSDAAGFTLIFVTHAIDEAILVGTRLHLLSARPGRTIATFDTHDIGFADLGSPRFASLHGKVHDLLFGTHASLHHG